VKDKPPQIDTTQVPKQAALTDVTRFESRRAHHFP